MSSNNDVRIINIRNDNRSKAFEINNNRLKFSNITRYFEKAVGISYKLGDKLISLAIDDDDVIIFPFDTSTYIVDERGNNI